MNGPPRRGGASRFPVPSDHSSASSTAANANAPGANGDGMQRSPEGLIFGEELVGSVVFGGDKKTPGTGNKQRNSLDVDKAMAGLSLVILTV